MSVQQQKDYHDAVVTLTARVETALAIYKFWAIILIPLCGAYIVYEHQTLDRIQTSVSDVRTAVTGIDAHGSKFLVDRARRDHYGQGCHFKTAD